LAGDLLRPEVLLYRDGIVRTALDRRVVAHDHAISPLDPSDAGDEAGPVDGIVVEPVGGERRQLEERAAGIEQAVDTLPRQKLPTGGVAVPRLLRAAERCSGPALLEFARERRHPRAVRLELGGARVD